MIKIRYTILVVSLLLLFTSVPYIFRILLEAQYRAEIGELYEIDYNAIPKTVYQAGSHSIKFEYKKTKIQVQIVNLRGETQATEQGFKRLADIDLYLNGQKQDRLQKRILEKEYAEEPFDLKSIDDMRIFLLTDKQTNEEKLVILEDVSQFQIATNDPGRGYYEYFPMGVEKGTRFRTYLIDKHGKIETHTFGYQEDRTKLQTYLAQQIAGFRFGHYTDLFESYVSFVVPFLYPFFSAFMGLCLLPFFVLLKVKKGRESSKV